MTSLVVAFPGSVIRDATGTRYSMDVKTLDGLHAYRRHWPGRIVLAAPLAPPELAPGPGERWFGASDGIDVATGNTSADAVRAAGPGLVLASLTPRIGELADVLDRTVLVVEFAPEELTRHDAARQDHLARLRTRLGGWRRAASMDRLAARVRGVQANGHPAFDHFAPLARSALLFFDTRLTAEHLRLARETPRRPPGRRLRLCFSGRLIAAKGPSFALDVARALGDAATLVMLGTGEQAAELRWNAPENVRFGGHLDFDPDWTRFVREEVDVMLLPHIQGDPSGTYLEAAGCGIPVLGFDNVALDSLVRHHGLGWTVPLGDSAALAAAAKRVLAQPDAWAAARSGCLDFMAEHHFEAEYARRVAHLLSLS